MRDGKLVYAHGSLTIVELAMPPGCGSSKKYCLGREAIAEDRPARQARAATLDGDHGPRTRRGGDASGPGVFHSVPIAEGYTALL